jgi:hypothetical protein
MHEEDRVKINYYNYHKAFSDWTRTNKRKLSIVFDKEIGIGGWKKGTIKIKYKQKFFLAKIKYGL